MGRKRLPEIEVKVPISIKIQKKLLDELREKLQQDGILITHFFENAIKDFLKK